MPASYATVACHVKQNVSTCPIPLVGPVQMVSKIARTCSKRIVAFRMWLGTCSLGTSAKRAAHALGAGRVKTATALARSMWPVGHRLDTPYQRNWTFGHFAHHNAICGGCACCSAARDHTSRTRVRATGPGMAMCTVRVPRQALETGEGGDAVPQKV
jgi:hypothetical protein